MLTHEYLRETLHYSIITGQFYWLKSVGRRVKVGDVAGSLEASGYKRIRINRKLYLAHRLAWFWVMGSFPENDTDHVNGIKDANQWLNLREATRSQNMCNTCMQSNNTSGYKGVYWNKRDEKWMAYITLNKKTKHLGYFDDIEAAYTERLKAEKDLHGDYARL